jgi:tetratricopeptide (TPR) repeat protein
MIGSPILETTLPTATSGDIAVLNLESARQRSWSRLWQSPEPPGIAECIVEQEQMTLQLLSDSSALDRLESLTEQLVRRDADPSRIALILAQVAATKHHFSEARGYLQKAETHGSTSEAANRLLLSIDQACGERLDAVLDIRREMASRSGRLEDLVPLGALLADLGEFEEADKTYQRAFREYRDVSPFALAWLCFQLGVLWGELVPDTQSSRAADWYQMAINYVPSYVKARVHLSEIYLGDGMTRDAEALLLPALSSGDPEVEWRLADVMIANGDFEAGKAYLQTARARFEALLERYLLAFADHGAEFYSGSGDDPERANALAAINLANRPTLRAFEQTYKTAVNGGQLRAASETLTAARIRWGNTRAFGLSSLAECETDKADTSDTDRS